MICGHRLGFPIFDTINDKLHFGSSPVIEVLVKSFQANIFQIQSNVDAYSYITTPELLAIRCSTLVTECMWVWKLATNRPKLCSLFSYWSGDGRTFHLAFRIDNLQ